MPTGYVLVLIFPVLAAVFRIWACAGVDGSARISAWDCAVDQFKALALFGIMGPLVGTLAAFLVVSLRAGTMPNPSAVLFLLWFAYPVGAIPALATGAFMGALKPWLWGWRALAVSSTMGALLSSLPLLAGGDPRAMSDAAFFAACGAVAGLACARLFFGAPGKASG